MANNLLTMSYITNEALVVLENELVIANRCERQYSNEFAQTGAKIGNTVNIRRPPRYIGTYGPPLNVEDSNETFLPVVLNYQFHVDVQFTTQDLRFEHGHVQEANLEAANCNGCEPYRCGFGAVLHLLDRNQCGDARRSAVVLQALQRRAGALGDGSVSHGRREELHSRSHFDVGRDRFDQGPL